MSNLISGLIIGSAVGGAIGYFFKRNSVNRDNANALSNELYEVNIEVEKYRKRYKETEREVEDLQYENSRLRKKLDNKGDSNIDLEGDLEIATEKAKQLEVQNNYLLSELKEYKAANEVQEIEIARLKDK